MIRKSWSLYLVVLLILILAVFLTFSTKISQAQKVSSPELYKKNCASCHGADGKGVEKMAKMLKVTIKDWTKLTLTPDLFKDWKKITTAGKGKMPAYEKKLKEAEIDSVLIYARSFTTAPAKTETSPSKDTTKISADTSKKK